MEFHPSKIPISKTFDVKDEKQATEAAHEMVMIGFEKEDKGFKVLMSKENEKIAKRIGYTCLLYTSPSPRDLSTSRMPSSA